MNKWVKRKWLRALKSGEYAKGKGRLGIPGKEYCCLGVLACEMVPEFVHVENSVLVITAGPDWSSSTAYLPDDLITLWGLSYLNQDELAAINDKSADFSPVIAYIESNL